MYLKVIGVLHVILAFLKVLLLLKLLERRWLLVLLRWLDVYSRSQRQNKSSTYTKLRNSTPIQKNSKQN